MTPASLFRRLLWPTSPGAFRLWLALVVVLHHVTRIEIGTAPVLVFFVLSGYWVHRVWLEQYSQTGLAWFTFLVSRWWRIVPVLLLGSLICVPLLWLVHDPDWALVAASRSRQWMSAIGVFGYALLPVRPVGPAWSLDIEMQFYLVAPLLVALVRRVSSVLVLTLGCCVFLAAMTLGAGVTLPSFLLFFLIGMVAAERRWSPPPVLAHSSLACAIGLALAAIVLPTGHDLVREGSSESALFNMALGVLAIPFALATVGRKGDRTDAMLADQSYLVYMLHWPAIELLRHLPLVGVTSRFAAAFVVLAMVVVFSHFVWLWLDRPLNRVRKRWVQSRSLLLQPGAVVAKGGDKAALFA